MSLSVALVLGGSLVYALVPTDAGALMIAAGCALALVAWLDQRLKVVAE
jgi:hypothetical protein